jgi:hypothetical protein
MVRLVFTMINEMAFVKILKKNSIFNPHNSNKSIITTCIAKYENAIKMILACISPLFSPFQNNYPPLGKGKP